MACVHWCFASQKLMSVGIPMLLAELYTSQRSASQCLSVGATPHPNSSPPAQHGVTPPLRVILTVLHTLAEELLTMLRAIYLAALFMPIVISQPLANISPDQRARWLELVRWTLERAGPAFIKWGQWAATRPDLFPPDLCVTLESLQSVRVCCKHCCHTPGDIWSITTTVAAECSRTPLCTHSRCGWPRLWCPPRGHLFGFRTPTGGLGQHRPGISRNIE